MTKCFLKCPLCKNYSVVNPRSLAPFPRHQRPLVLPFLGSFSLLVHLAGALDGGRTCVPSALHGKLCHGRPWMVVPGTELLQASVCIQSAEFWGRAQPGFSGSRRMCRFCVF